MTVVYTSDRHTQIVISKHVLEIIIISIIGSISGLSATNGHSGRPPINCRVIKYRRDIHWHGGHHMWSMRASVFPTWKARLSGLEGFSVSKTRSSRKPDSGLILAWFWSCPYFWPWPDQLRDSLYRSSYGLTRIWPETRPCFWPESQKRMWGTRLRLGVIILGPGNQFYWKLIMTGSVKWSTTSQIPFFSVFPLHRNWLLDTERPWFQSKSKFRWSGNTDKRESETSSITWRFRSRWVFSKIDFRDPITPSLSYILFNWDTRGVWKIR